MKKNKKRILYTCGINWHFRDGAIAASLWKTKAALKRESPCWKECGIVELTITGKWVSPQKLPSMKQKKDTGV